MRLRPTSLLVSAALVVGVIVTGPPASAANVAPPTAVPTTHAAQFDSASPNPVLSWDAVPGATKYHVQISASSTFGSPVYDKETVGLQATPDQNLPLGTLFWRVAAGNTSGLGPYSDADQFTTAWQRAPSQVAPADSAVLSFPSDPAVFTWKPLSGAKSYELWVDDSSDFINPQIFTTSNTSFVLTEPQTVGQNFYWQVRGLSATNNLVSEWSPVRSYSFAWPSTPILVRPANGATVSDPNLSWQPVPGASQYHLQISSNIDFSNNIVVDETVKGTAYTPDPTLPNGAYYWRVQALDASVAKHFGPYSSVRSFTRPASPAPTILSPLPPADDPGGTAVMDDTPTFAWTPVDHASSYEVQVSTEPSFVSPYTCTTNHTRFTPMTFGTGLCTGQNRLDSLVWQPGTTYYWRVRGVDDPSGIVGIWSSASAGAFDFVRNGTAPTPEQPANGSTVTAPVLRWDPVDGALKYQVTIYDANHTALVNVSTFATSYVPTTTLPLGTYTWTVQSIDAQGSMSGVSVDAPVWSFVLAAPSTSNTTPDPTSSPTTSTRMPALTWAPVAGATKYTVHYAANGIDRGALASNLPFAGYAATGIPLPTGDYTWWVDAFNQNSLIGTGSRSSFTITGVTPVSMASLVTSYQTTEDPSTDVTCGGTEICGDTPTFAWAAVPDATSYRVTVATDKDFTTVAHTYTTRYPTLTPRDSYLDSQAGDAYYWYVQACVDFVTTTPSCGPGADDPIANAGAPSFKKRSRGVLLCPPDNATASDPTLCPLSQIAPDPNRQTTFSWADYLKGSAGQTSGASAPGTQSAARYQIQVSTVADFATTVDTETIDGTSYTPWTKTYPVGPLFWRVRAIDNSDNDLTWSDTAQINKSLPAPVQNVTVDRSVAPPPSPPTVTGMPLLTWQPSDFAASYAVEIYKNGDTTFSKNNLVKSDTTKFTAYSPPLTSTAGSYAWRVRGVDADGKPGPWYTDTVATPDRKRITFTVQAPYPSLTGPADSTQLNSGNALFTWDGVDQAAQYRWQLSTTAGFSTISASQTTVMTAWSPLTPFPDGAYYWRVQALDSSGNVMSSSAPRAISKDSSAPTATTIAPTVNPGLTDPITVTFSEPVHGVTTSSFLVVPVGSRASAPGTVHAAGTSATWTPTSPLVPGQTYTVSVTGAISDAFGNALVARSWTMRTTTVAENDSPAFHEQWDRDTARAASGGSYDSSRTKGATATFAFTGSSVSLLGMVGRTGGNAAVAVDGAKAATTVSFYNARTLYRHTVWSKSGLAIGPHTVTVRVLGTKPKGATDSWVYVDGVKAGSTTYEQSSPAVTEWFARQRTANASGGSYDTVTHVTGGDTSSAPSYSITVCGTGVSIYGVRSTKSGKAAVFIDGRRRATVDLHATATSYKSLLYALSGLPNRVHTVRIDVLGSRTGAASSVGVDYVRVS